MNRRLTRRIERPLWPATRKCCREESTIRDNSTDELLVHLQRWANYPLDDRLSVLGSLVEYWRPGSRSFVARPPVALPQSLPRPLHWFYDTLSRDTSAFRSDYGGWAVGGNVVGFHWVKRPERLTVDDFGVVEFLDENQGVYTCGTKADNADPCVFIREIGQQEWSPTTDRLTDFLLVLLAFEFTQQGEYAAAGSFANDAVHAGSREMIKLLHGVARLFLGPPVSVYHGRGTIMLACPLPNGEVFLQASARSAAEFESLRSFGEWEHWLPRE
jgi:hypothetical protein